MCWAFSLFIAGLVLALALPPLLGWASDLPAEYPIMHPMRWSILLQAYMFLTTAVVITAISILISTVYLLDFDALTNPGTAVAAVSDTPIRARAQPKAPAILALTAIGTIVLYTSVLVGLWVMSTGVRKFLRMATRSRYEARMMTKSLEDYR
jgi:hypothetical protein